jgi:lipoate-protein ligase A
LIIDPPADGVWNMAADEYLLRTALPRSEPTLRLYRWSRPTLSLGYFQRYAARQQHKASEACPAVRRASGGGAIVHDREWTYSLCIPIADRWSSATAELYQIVHQSIIDLLAQFGIPTQLSNQQTTAGENAPFLCFQRRAIGDLLCQGHKVAGSAQRRSQGALLQHGSVLLHRSIAAPELPGINDLSSLPPQGDQFFVHWPLQLAQILGWELTEQSWSDEERLAVEAGEARKFKSEAWLRRR